MKPALYLSDVLLRGSIFSIQLSFAIQSAGLLIGVG